MNTTTIKGRVGAALLSAGLAFGLVSTASADENLRMASIGAASPATVFSIALSEILKNDLGYKVKLSTGAPATRQAVDAAHQELDLFVTAVSINHYMKNNLRMFKDMENAPELFSSLRGITNYPLGAYLPVVWADSGIETLADIRGKRVFTGPPTGAARTIVAQIIKGSTGMEPKTDFETANYDWSSANQAFQDHQIDVYFVPSSLPSPQIAQLAVLGKIRILAIDDAALESEEMKRAVQLPGRSFVNVPVGLYPNLVNEVPTRVLRSTIGLGTNKWMTEEVAYNITKSLFTHGDELISAGAWMKEITVENGLAQMNMPLHVGAYKYYVEAGIDVPAELIPPEAK